MRTKEIKPLSAGACPFRECSGSLAVTKETKHSLSRTSMLRPELATPLPQKSEAVTESRGPPEEETRLGEAGETLTLTEK